jgi:purine-binding chemotaxis protein CheW
MPPLKNRDKEIQIIQTTQFVTFQMGAESYGINIMDVDEIHALQPVRPLPHTPAYVEGIFNLRGEIIPIINLHNRFNLKKIEMSSDDELLSGFVIINISGLKVGIVIDRILRVVSIVNDEIQPPPQVLTGIGNEYVNGVVNQEGGSYLIILDIHRLFDASEIARLKSF